MTREFELGAIPAAPSAVEKIAHGTRGKGQYTSSAIVDPLLSVPVNLRDTGNTIELASRLSFLTDMEVVRLTTPPAQAEATLPQVAEQFTHWRQSRRTPYGPRIPEALWTEAIRLMQVLPLTHVAKALHLKPHALKRRSGISLTAAAPPALELPFVYIRIKLSDNIVKL